MLQKKNELTSHACSIVFSGSLFGLSPITSYIESGAGVEAGAKTGLTAVICAFYFFISIFFAPIFASIPPWAIGGALILVGALMARSLAKLNFNKVSHAVSGFLTVMVMPLTYSIAYGLIAGISTYIVMESVFWVLSFAGLKVPGDEKEADMHILGKSSVEMIEGKTNDVETSDPVAVVMVEEEEGAAKAIDGDEEAAEERWRQALTVKGSNAEN